jgi:hypothetical protein
MSKNNHNNGESDNCMNNNSSSNFNKGKGKQKSDNNLKNHAGGRPKGKPNGPSAQKPGRKPQSEAPPPKDQRKAVDNMEYFQKATKFADHKYVCVQNGMKNFNSVIYIYDFHVTNAYQCMRIQSFSLSLYKSNNNYNLRHSTGIESNEDNGDDAGSSSAQDDLGIMDEIINCL